MSMGLKPATFRSEAQHSRPLRHTHSSSNNSQGIVLSSYIIWCTFAMVRSLPIHWLLCPAPKKLTILVLHTVTFSLHKLWISATLKGPAAGPREPANFKLKIHIYRRSSNAQKSVHKAELDALSREDLVLERICEHSNKSSPPPSWLWWTLRWSSNEKDELGWPKRPMGGRWKALKVLLFKWSVFNVINPPWEWRVSLRCRLCSLFQPRNRWQTEEVYFTVCASLSFQS